MRYHVPASTGTKMPTIHLIVLVAEASIRPFVSAKPTAWRPGAMSRLCAVTWATAARGLVQLNTSTFSFVANHEKEWCENGRVFEQAFSKISSAVRDACRDVYAERLVGLVLFGSVALGTMRADSDVDLLVVAEPLPEWRMDRTVEWDGVERLCAPTLERARRRGVDTRLAPMFRTPDELALGGFIIYDIAFDGVILYDFDARIESYFAEVRDRLDARGAVRASFRGMPYWVLKPDVRPGEVVEI